MTKQIVTVFLLLASFSLIAQTNEKSDPVLFSVGKTDVNVAEFEYIYSKANGKKADFSEESLKEYLDLYTKFKLKVQKAKDMKLDTIPALKRELDGYRRQLASTYLQDKAILNDLVKEAHERIRPYIHRTPVLTSTYLNNLTGARLYFKCENFQKAGAFKARGALNAVLSLSEESIKNGVATHSSGNHAAALAMAPRYAKLDLKRPVLQRLVQRNQRHRFAFVINRNAVIAPFVDAHFLADQIDIGGRARLKILALTQQINRHRRLMPMRHGRDDIHRPKRRIPTKEHIGPG